MKSGVYKIQNLKNGKMYIGSAKDLPRRKSHHFWNLKHGTHPNKFLQSAYNKYGLEFFKFEIIIICAADDRVVYEQKCIDLYKVTNNKFGYNLRKIAESNSGLRGSSANQKKFLKNLWQDPEYLKKEKYHEKEPTCHNE